jgi:gliding motility-associated protein GldC
MLAFWDAADKSALRIDLWTKDMMVDEMADFYYQTFMGMADTFIRATQDQVLAGEMKDFAKSFYKKFRDSQIQKNK